MSWRGLVTWGVLLAYCQASLGIPVVEMPQPDAAPATERTARSDDESAAADNAATPTGNAPTAAAVAPTTAHKTEPRAAAATCCRSGGAGCQCTAERRAAGNCCCAARLRPQAPRACCAGSRPKSNSRSDDETPVVWNACTCGSMAVSWQVAGDPRIVTTGAGLPVDVSAERLVTTEAPLHPQASLAPETPPPEASAA